MAKPVQLITVTSDNYVGHTHLMLESLRVWHGDPERYPMTVYALETGWTNEHTRSLDPFDVTVKLLHEADTKHRNADGSTAQNTFKLDAFLDQDSPFLLIDSDILVLRPLDEALEKLLADGWFSVFDNARLETYYEGDITGLIDLPDELASARSFNSGVFGFDPVAHPEYRQTVQRAKEWAGQVRKIYTGDQALLNFAYLEQFGRVPDNSGYDFNSGLDTQGRFELGRAILHQMGPNYRVLGEDRQAVHRALWQAYPRLAPGQPPLMTRLDQTAFWRASLPHPWDWINQCNQRRYRKKVEQMRERSKALLDPVQIDGLAHTQTDWLVLNSEHEAYLLDDAVLKAVEDFWQANAHRLADLKYFPTLHLDPGGVAKHAGLVRRLARKAGVVIQPSPSG